MSTAGHQAREAALVILRLAGLASCRRHPLSATVMPRMPARLLLLVLLSSIPPLGAAEEFVASAFRVSVPSTWTLKRGGASSALLESVRRPDCEMGGRLYETQHSFLSIAWRANESFDTESTNWGPITPAGAYADMVDIWRGQVKAREIVDVETREVDAQPPVIKQILISGRSATMNRRVYYVAMLREEGFGTLELLAGPEEHSASEFVVQLVGQMTYRYPDGELPACRFRGTGGPRLWRTWPRATR